MKCLRILLCSIFLIIGFVFPVHADMGPKPDLVIDFSGIQETCYVTVLSTVEQYGPNRPLDRSSLERLDFTDRIIDQEIYLKFIDETERLNRSRSEELYFWGVLETDSPFTFGYYPPETFYVLAYFPDSDTFLLSEESFTRKAFHTQMEITVENGKLRINSRQPLYGIMQAWKVDEGVILRLTLTVAVEILIGLFFVKYTKRSIITVILVNVLTQVLLNMAIWMRYYVLNNSAAGYFPALLAAEGIIFLLEGFIYSRGIPREELAKPYQYALCANAVTFLMGLANILPGF